MESPDRQLTESRIRELIAAMPAFNERIRKLGRTKAGRTPLPLPAAEDYPPVGSLADVVKCTVYVTDRADWQPMNEVYFANFSEDPPHRVSCIVRGLGSPECLVEIDATAFLDSA